MSIGEAARRSGCSVPTIRYYESIGLLPAAGRTAAGRRVFGVPEVRRLAFIRRSRDLGMPIEQVRELLDARDDPARPCASAAAVVQAQLELLRAKQAELRLLEGSLRAMLDRCDATCGSTAGAAACNMLDDPR